MTFQLGQLSDCESRIKRDFVEFSRLWVETKESWSDARRTQFERECLSTIGPSLSRFSTAMHEFCETVQQANQALEDDEQSL